MLFHGKKIVFFTYTCMIRMRMRMCKVQYHLLGVKKLVFILLGVKSLLLYS